MDEISVAQPHKLSLGLDMPVQQEGPATVPSMEPLEVSEDPASSSPARSKLRIFSIILMLCLVLFIAALDQTIVATAIPSMTKDLNSAAGYTWIGASYLLAMCAANPTWVRISDIWGRKPAVLGANIVFTIGSVIAGASTTMPMLIAGRGVQGLAGGGIMSLVSIIIADLFSMRHRSLYVSATALVWVLTGTTGPVIGGTLSQYATWRWCFWINLPVCGIALVVIFFFLDLHNPHTQLRDGLKAIDWLGTVSTVTIILLLLLGLDFGGVTFAWDSPTVICMIVVGILLVGFFIFAERRLVKYPLLDLRVFLDWSNNAAVLIAVSHSMATTGTEYYLPLYFQSVKQASPSKSGLLILPMMITASLCDVSVGVLVHKTGRYREIIWAGTMLLTLGTGLYITFGTDTSLAHIIGFQVIGGIGFSMLLITPMLALQNNVAQPDVAVATGTLGFMRSIATSLSIVLGGVVFQNSMSGQQPSLVSAGLDDAHLMSFSGQNAAASVELVASVYDPAQNRAVLNAYSVSIRNMFILYMAVAAVGLLASPFIKQRHMSEEHQETKTGIENMTAHEPKNCVEGCRERGC